MITLLTAAAIAVGAGDLLLLLASWRTQTVLAGVLGLVGFALAVWAVVAGPMGRSGKLTLVGTVVALVLGY